MRADRAHLILLTACACMGEHSYVDLPPFDDSVRSIIVVKEGDGFTLQAYHADRAPTSLELEREVLIVTVLHYAASLEDLGLPAGPLSIASEGDCASLPLPAATAIYQGGAGRELEPVAVLTEAIAALRVSVACPCVDFEVAAFELPGALAVRSTLPYDERRSLVVTDRALTLVDESARTEEIAVPIAFWGAFEDQQGVFWFGDAAGQLWLGDPLGDLRQTFASSATSDVVRIAGYVAADAFELLMVSNDRLLQRFDGARWEVLYSQPPLSNDQDGDILFLERGRAVITLPNGDGLLHYDAAKVNPIELEQWDSARNGHLIALEQIDGFGMFIATRTGRLFLRRMEDGLLQEMDDPIPLGDRPPVADLQPFRGGMIEVGRRGFIRQWHPASGFCEPINVDLQVDLFRIAPLGDGFVVGGVSRDPINRGFVIRPVQP